jgi:hypothetical protein
MFTPPQVKFTVSTGGTNGVVVVVSQTGVVSPPSVKLLRLPAVPLVV